MDLRYVVRLKQDGVVKPMWLSIAAYAGLNEPASAAIKAVFNGVRASLTSLKTAKGGTYSITLNEVVDGKGGDDDPPIERYDHLTYAQVITAQERLYAAEGELLALGKALAAERT